jgi:transposase-like protein
VNVEIPGELAARLECRLPHADVGSYVRYAVAAAAGALSEGEERIFNHALLLGTADDAIVAEALAVEIPVVVVMREELGIPEHAVPAKEREQERERERALALLQEPGATMSSVARSMGRCRSFVRRVKEAHEVVLTRDDPYGTALSARDRLGTTTDKLLAEELSVSSSVVGKARRALGIPPFKRPKVIDEAAAARMLELGMSISSVARELQVTNKRISQLRRKLGFPPPKRVPKTPKSDVVLGFEHLLGKVPDGDVAELAQVSAATVARVRQLLGISPYVQSRRR